jgi:hypothetical protein
MKKLEGKPAPKWNGLRIEIAKSRRGINDVSGFAFYHGRGAGYKPWDVFLGVPHNSATEHQVAHLVYHELMHTYGYKHHQYNDIPKSELERLFPDNLKLELKPDAVIRKKREPRPIEYGKFPIKIRMTRHTIDELESAEYGSYEDWCSDGKPERERGCHTVEICWRHKTTLELRNEDELREVFWAVDSGTFGIHCPGAQDRLWMELRKHIAALPKSN